MLYLELIFVSDEWPVKGLKLMKQFHFDKYTFFYLYWTLQYHLRSFGLLTESASLPCSGFIYLDPWLILDNKSIVIAQKGSEIWMVLLSLYA